MVRAASFARNRGVPPHPHPSPSPSPSPSPPSFAHAPPASFLRLRRLVPAGVHHETARPADTHVRARLPSSPPAPKLPPMPDARCPMPDAPVPDDLGRCPSDLISLRQWPTPAQALLAPRRRVRAAGDGQDCRRPVRPGWSPSGRSARPPRPDRHQHWHVPHRCPSGRRTLSAGRAPCPAVDTGGSEPTSSSHRTSPGTATWLSGTPARYR